MDCDWFPKSGGWLYTGVIRFWIWEQLYLSLCHIIWLSVCPLISRQLRQFQATFIFIKKKFHPQILFSPPKKFPTFTFLCISGCFRPSWVLKKIFTPNCFSPRNYLGKQGMTQFYQAFLVCKTNIYSLKSSQPSQFPNFTQFLFH